MRNSIRRTAIVSLLACGALFAQSTSSPNAAGTPPPAAPTSQQPATSSAPSGANQANPATQPRIAPGSVIPVALTKTVDAKKAKTGDEVVAKVTQDMKSQSGDVVVPKDTKVVGHVTEAQARNKEQKESQLAIAFDQAILKNQQVQLPMSIQAVIGPENPNNAGGPANDQGTPSQTANSGAGSTGGSRNPMGGAGQSQPSNSSAPSDNSNASQENAKRPPINANTQGVIGISNVTLSTAGQGTQGSVLTSEKNNVKLESGTMLLLKVNQTNQ